MCFIENQSLQLQNVEYIIFKLALILTELRSWISGGHVEGQIICIY